MEPFKVKDALHDPDWVMAMQEELNNFKRNQAIRRWHIHKPNQVYT
jgi:hypothetical protein